MFNLFGSFFFGRPSTVEAVETDKQQLNNNNNNETTDACTQTTTTTTTQQTELTQNEGVNVAPAVANTSTVSADWVIVDRNENSLLKSVSTSTIGLESALSKSTAATDDKMVCDLKEEQEIKDEKEDEMRTDDVAVADAGGDAVIDGTRMLALAAAERFIQELCPTITEEPAAIAPAAADDDYVENDHHVIHNPLVESTDDVLLGSFFDRNEVDMQPETETETETSKTKVDDWLITPLPCLTSITCSQRSIIDNDPLENLLIEHPSMSVFVTVTSSSTTTTSSSSPSSTSISSASSSSSTINNAEFIIMQSIEDENEKIEEQKPQQKQQQQPMMKKRKAALVEQQQHQQQQQQPSGESSPTSTIKRKGKKNKKSSSPSPVPLSAVTTCATTTTNSSSSNNKENMQQVKCHQAFMSELRRQQVTASKLDAILLNKNHLKRNNNKVTNKFAHANMQQRKFHKLQQPAF